jgi:hypothetical protein
MVEDVAGASSRADPKDRPAPTVTGRSSAMRKTMACLSSFHVGYLSGKGLFFTPII